jgi:hypothetical protein
MTVMNDIFVSRFEYLASFCCYARVVTDGFERQTASKSDKTSVRWHAHQEKLFVELICSDEFKPIGFDADGVMGRKVDCVWKLLLSRFLAENEKLIAREQTTKTGLGLKTDFSVKALPQKYGLLREKYQQLKREFKVGRCVGRRELQRTGKRPLHRERSTRR